MSFGDAFVRGLSKTAGRRIAGRPFDDGCAILVMIAERRRPTARRHLYAGSGGGLPGLPAAFEISPTVWSTTSPQQNRSKAYGREVGRGDKSRTPGNLPCRMVEELTKLQKKDASARFWSWRDRHQMSGAGCACASDSAFISLVSSWPTRRHQATVELSMYR